MMKLPPRYTPKSAPVAGGYGSTVICKDNTLNRDVVIKEILDPNQVKRIIDEVVALHAAKSKHVVEVFDVILSPDGKNLAIVEEYLPGKDLSAVKFDPHNATPFLKVMYQIARGLSDIHSRDIVHRDIKPNNMKFDAEDYVKIFDFGLAKGVPLPGTTNTLTGTAGFMAPELFSFPPQIDKPVDVYAFGAMMFCFIAGKLPPCARPWPNPPVALTPLESIEHFGFNYPKLVPLVDACLDLNPVLRPQATDIRFAFEKELLFGKHKATLTTPSKTLVLDKVGGKVRAKHLSNEIEITYDGYDFVVSLATGAVYVNNKLATKGQVLDGSHVLTLAAAGNRLFVTFDVNHPEVHL